MAMSEYERERAENIARKAEMLAKLGIQDSARNWNLLKPNRVKKEKPKGYKLGEKRSREPIVLRRSLRTRGIAPTSECMEISLSRKTDDDSIGKHEKISWEKPVPFSKVHGVNQPADDDLCASILENQQFSDWTKRMCVEEESSFIPLKLNEKDVARVVPERIFSLLLLPLWEKSVVLAGDKAGNIGIWNADCSEEEEEPVRIYHPHASPVAGMAYAPHQFAKILTCSYDCATLVMDIEKGVFNRVYSGSEAQTALCCPAEGSCVYIGEGEGELKMLDYKSNKIASSHNLHEKRINTIDSNTQRPYLVATSSTDGTASIWDVRSMGQTSLATIQHSRAVHSAYFSPSGNQLASTSYDNHIGLVSGILQQQKLDMIQPTMIYHNNQTNRWISNFRAIWSWNDDNLFIANMTRAIDVVSIQQKRSYVSLRSDDMTSIPCRLALHPLLPNSLAGGTAGGKVFLWRRL